MAQTADLVILGLAMIYPTSFLLDGSLPTITETAVQHFPVQYCVQAIQDKVRQAEAENEKSD